MLIIRRRTFISLLLLVVGLHSACAVNSGPASATPGGLSFIHLNDTYRIGAVEDGTKGGFGRVVTVIRELKEEGRDVRLLHGGDFLYPSLESQLWNGQQIIEAFNYLDALAPMIAVAGNHEFDRRTPEHLINAVNASNFVWVGDNYRFVTGNAATDAALQSNYTFDYGGKTIGVLALTLHPDDGGTDRDYVPTKPDYLGEARQHLAALTASGVDLIIGVTHLHLHTDAQIAALKAEFDKLAFVVGGHEHEPQFVDAAPGQAPVMKGASNARVIWRIDVDYDAAGIATVTTTRLPMDVSVAEDPDYALLDQKWRDRLLAKYPFLTAPVGMANVDMNATEESVRNAENGWGNFIVDQMRTAFDESPSDLAFINSGTLRLDDYVRGDILFEDIGRTFGFSSFLRRMSISGAEFRQVMEAGYRGQGPSKGYFPQISGFRVCVDRRRRSGDRIVSLQLPGDTGWREIDGEQIYSLVVPDFLYGGGDGYQLPQNRPVTPAASELKYLVLDAVIVAQADGRGVGSLPDPDNPRYVELDIGREECWPQAN